MPLGQLRLHRGERFTYVYNFIDHWVCDLRLEAVLPLDSRRRYPVCLGGKRAAPPEDCGGAWAYLQRVDRHHVPLEAMAVVATVLNRLLKADDQTTIRQIIGDRETFREAVDQLDAYLQFRPEHFDRRDVNTRLRALVPARRNMTMKYAIQVVITTDEGQTETQEIACVEREDLTPTTLGLTLAEGKAILKALQAVVVQQQLTAYLETQRPCAHCGHGSAVRGIIPRRSGRSSAPSPSTACVSTSASVNPTHPTRPRRSVPWPCCCQNRSRRSCCFWRRSGPPWCRMASPPSSYRRCCRSMTRSPPAPFGSMSSPSRNGWSSSWGRNSGRSSTAARRSGAGCPSPMARSRWASMGATSAPRPKQGWFEVIAGKSLLAFTRGEESEEPVSSKCFAFVQTFDQKPKRRLFEVLQSQGHQLNQQITFLSDGGDTVRELQLYLNPHAEHLLDWFHVDDAAHRAPADGERLTGPDQG